MVEYKNEDELASKTEDKDEIDENNVILHVEALSNSKKVQGRSIWCKLFS